VTAALQHALRQSPDLKRIEAELTREMTRLRNVLDPESPASPLEQALLARLHAVTDNALPAFRNLPDQFLALGLLEETSAKRLRAAFQKRFSVIQALSVPPDPETEAKRNNASRLGRALAGQLPAIVLIDGHNMLFGLPARYNPPRGGAATEADKRNRMIADIVRIAAPSPAVRIGIVFDGPERMDTHASPNVRITYSGGTGEHRADHVLLDNLRFYRKSDPEMTVMLVSNDVELCTSARRLGAVIIPVLDFGAFL